MGPSAFIVGIVGFIALSISFPILVSYLLDRRVHEGVDWFKRRRVLRSGQLANATVLSSTLMVGRGTGSKYSGAYSIVYEVMPENGARFRARGIEVLFFSEAHNNLSDGKSVQVRFDERDRTVVLVRVDAAQALRDRDERRRAQEEALLRGRP